MPPPSDVDAETAKMARADGNRRRPGRTGTVGRGQLVTLQAIADRAGVSRSTVSNAYNRPDQLAPALRERILRIAADLRYPGPHAVARNLRRGHVGVVGLLLTEALTYAFSDPAAVRFLQGVSEILEATDVGLLLVPAQPGHAFDPVGIRGAMVDAFLIYSVSDDHPAVAEVLRRGVPTVIVDQPRLRDAALVTIDDEAAAYAAARHLVDLGHRRFAILSDRLSVEPVQPGVRVSSRKESGFLVTRSRLNGFRRALEEAGVGWDAVPIAECFPNMPETGREALSRILDMDPRPTGVLCITDQIALGALRGATDLRLDVPRHLSIVGFDDIPAAESANPPLTTVHQPLLDKGRVAARMLAAGGDSPFVRLVELATELIVRASSGPAPLT